MKPLVSKAPQAYQKAPTESVVLQNVLHPLIDVKHPKGFPDYGK